MHIYVHVVTRYGHRIGETFQSVAETLIDLFVIRIVLYILGQLIVCIAISAGGWNGMENS